MDEILKMLGIDKLDESKQSEITTKLKDIVQLKVDESVKEKEAELKETLTEQYEEKFEEYKEDLTEKFSNFLDEVLNEEMVIPEEIREFARKGQLYSDLIESFKIRIGIDEGLLDEEAKEIMGEAKEEILKLREKQNELISENLELKSDAKELSAHIYLTEKCNELTLPQKERAMKLLEGITDKEEIDRKISIIVESKSDDDDTVLGKETKTITKKEEDLNENKKISMMDYWTIQLKK